MSLKVISFCTYRTSKGAGWKNRDWAASKLVKAIKGKPVNGYADIPVGAEGFRRLDATNVARAPAIFALIAGQRVKWNEAGPIAFVPIPDSDCAMGAPTAPRTLGLAKALAESSLTGDSIATDILRWDQPMPSSHQAGGTRDPQLLYPRLRLAGAVPPDRRIVLVDDVVTSGGHLRAAAAFLESGGATVAGAVCVGRADDGFTVDDAFATRIDSLESFTYDSALAVEEPFDDLF